MTDTEGFALALLVTSAAALTAVLLNRLTERTRIPTPLLILVGAAAIAGVVPADRMPDVVTVEHVVTVALISDPLRRRNAHRLPQVPRGRTAGRVGGPARDLPDGGGWSGAAASGVRDRLVPGDLGGHRGGPDRPRGGVLGAGSTSDPRPERHHPGGRVRRERPGRYRADGESARGWRPELAGGRPGRHHLRPADGGRRRGRGGWAAGACCGSPGKYRCRTRPCIR